MKVYFALQITLTLKRELQLSIENPLVWVSNPSGCEIFHTHPDGLWDSFSLLWVSLPCLRQLGLSLTTYPFLEPRIGKEGVEKYLYSPRGPSWDELYLFTLFFCWKHKNKKLGSWKTFWCIIVVWNISFQRENLWHSRVSFLHFTILGFLYSLVKEFLM